MLNGMSADGVEIEITKNSDAVYTALVRESVRRAVDESQVRDVFVVRVRDWFGPRWYGFSHTLLPGLAYCQTLGGKRVNVPPFVPTRVQSARRFVRADDGYVETTFGPPLHIAQYSDRNSKRKVADWSVDGLFVWYADAPEGADRGALMVYRTQARRCEGWYAGLKKSADGTWAFGDTRGIDAYVPRRRDADRRRTRSATPTIVE